MKKIHIIALLAILAGISIIIIGSKDISTYSNFSDAITGQSVKISGTLDLSQEIEYDLEKDVSSFSFFMVDSKGASKQVIINQPRPQDFEKAESVVVTGKMEGEKFMASEILLKCPSKYKDEEIRIRAEI